MISLHSRSLQIICVLSLLITNTVFADNKYNQDKFFQRIATFPVFLNTDVNEETVSEIVAATEDGKTLIYTDGEFGGIGFVDIKKRVRIRALLLQTS